MNATTWISALLFLTFGGMHAPAGEPLWAGVAKVNITHPEAEAGSNPLYARAMLLRQGGTTAVVVSIDAVAIAGIGPIRDPFLATVRGRLEEALGIAPAHVLINASHCHGRVCPDVAEKVVQAVREAAANPVPVRAGAGKGREDRIGINRRLILANGREADVRHAYSLPPDAAIEGVGPIDPEIGILRLDREDGTPLALLYNFACHPIQGVPGGGNTADLSGFSSKVIEENLGGGAVALFLQGCAGDINPVDYKQMDRPRDGEPLGNLLGLATLKAARSIGVLPNAALGVINRPLELPRADHRARIRTLGEEVDALLDSFQGTTLNLDTFIPLYVKYGVSGPWPSSYAHRYLQDEKLGVDHWKRLDDNNRAALEAYRRNVLIMEEITRKQINLALLERHQERNAAAGDTIEVEVAGLRVGDFRLVTFPGELTVEIGLNIKVASSFENTFVAGYTNGYIYYAPTTRQMRNVGGAQEDSDCLLGPGWQELFEARAAELLDELR